VSHLKERKEKICLNCKADLYGRFCHVCGQQNLEPKETVWHLVQHFFNDITHFDGSFFSTVKFLLRKPGFLSAEYIAGRRASYLNPIRMYVFTSAFFFIILFTLKKPEDMMKSNETKAQPKSLTELLKKKARYEKDLAATANGDDRDELQGSIKNLTLETGMIKKRYGDTTTRKFTDKELTGFMLESINDSLQLADIPLATKDRLTKTLHGAEHPDGSTNLFDMGEGHYQTVEAYDSTERALPDDLRDGWLMKLLMRKKIQAQEAYELDKERYKERFIENLVHSFPKILFWSLPFFALILNVLYFRHKRYYYVDHGIFTIHVYCATFILLLTIILVNQLSGWVNLQWFRVVCDILIFGLSIYIMIYLYKAMRGFYRQGRFKTFVKYFITCSLAFILNLILFLIFLLLSAINV
jgi:Protein of unknown function (DUF3667)